ncbi:MAG: hypothetical protein JWO86_2748 [Myxococcaceae bacterium]|nr:hypothetical protein [Myxococcaceae bacterium]
MSFSMASLLIHSEHLPVPARDALKAAQDGPPQSRVRLLESAARILYRDVGVECSDARELVGLQPGDCHE